MSSKSSMERRTRRAALLFLIPGGLFGAAIFVYPSLRTLQMSFSDVTAENITRGSWDFVGLANYRSVIDLPAFGVTLRNTVLFLVGSIVPQVVIGLLLAIGLRKSTRLRRVARALVLLPWLLPSAAVAAVFLLIFSARGGLVNWVLTGVGLTGGPVLWFSSPTTALVVIVVVNIWIGVPFNFLILQSGLQALPEEVHEAAAVDGAGWWRELISITVPMLRESLFAVVMLGIIGTLKVFDFVWIMTGGGPANGTMLPGPLAYQQAFVQFNYGNGSALIVLTVLVMLILSVIYVRATSERRIKRSVAPSAVPGSAAPPAVEQGIRERARTEAGA